MAETPEITNGDKMMFDQLAELYDAEIVEVECSDIRELITPLPFKDTSRYINDELIGTGGMKEVYKTFDTHTGRNVALATLLPDASNELYIPFVREARLTASLDHPNIITIHDIGTDARQAPYFTMELKTGNSLAKLITKSTGESSFGQSFEVQQQLLNIFVKVCDAVAYAHSQNILHLDLKPENIQVGEFGEVIVCDWGLGKMIGDPDHHCGDNDLELLSSDLLFTMTLSGQVKGTPGFMAPEQISNECLKTERTDIYALGAILYNLLCGQTTTSGTIEQMLDQTLEGTIPAPQSRAGHVPASLNAVAMKALNNSPDNRYQRVEELRNDIQNYLSGYATSAENANLLMECKLFYRRNKSVCSIALASLFILFTLTGLFVYNLNKNRIAAEQAKEHSTAMQLRAEKALTLYENEKARLDDSYKKFARTIEQDARPLRYHLFFSNPRKYINETIKRMNKVLSYDPENKIAIALKGNQHFLTQDFATANTIFAQSDSREEDLHILSKEFVLRPKPTHKLLAIDDFSELIARVGFDGFRNYLCERMVEYHAQKTTLQSPIYAPIVKTLVHAWAIKHKDSITPFTFNYNPDTRHLVLNGKSIKTVLSDSSSGSGRCILRYIPIKKLDISNTQIYSLTQITDLIHLEELNIADTLITDLSHIRQFPILKTLIVAPNQFSRKKLRSLSEQIKLVISSSKPPTFQ